MMLEQWCRRLIALGKAHPRLRWPLVALLALLYGAVAVWDGVKMLGTELSMLGREAAEHLKETAGQIAESARRLHRWNREHLPLAMARGREAWNASRPWCLNRVCAARSALRVRLTRGKELGGTFAYRSACGAEAAMVVIRADLPALRRHAPRRAMALALTLCMTFSLLPVSAFAAETDGCNHVHDESCYTRKLTCGMEESEGHAHTGDCYADALTCELSEHVHDENCYTDGVLTCALEEHTHGEACYTRELVCGLEESEGHAHTDACYEDVLDCHHVHDETCGALAPQEPETPECSCGAEPDETGLTVHTPDCPLYTAPETVCGTCGEDHLAADCPVEAVRALIAALPAPEAVAARMAKEEPTEEDYAQIDRWAEDAQRATDVYDALTPEQQALLPEARDVFDALMSAFRGEAMTLATTPHIHTEGNPGYIDPEVKDQGGYSYTNTFETPIATADELRAFIAEQAVTKNYTRATWGSAYLTADIDVSQLGEYGYGNLEIAKCVSICLNGHDITGGNTPGESNKPNQAPIITLYPDPAGSNNVNLDLHDCCGDRATRYGHWDGEQYTVSDTAPSGDYDVIPGGMIRSTTGLNAGIKVDAGTTLNILGGTIAGNSYGVDQRNTTGGLQPAHRRTRMCGGQIVGNKNAGIYMGNADMNTDIFGGRIANNRGGGVWNSSLSSSTDYPGAIPVLSLSGTPEISGNTKDGKPCNIYLAAPSSASVNSKKWAGKIQISVPGYTPLAIPDQPIGVTMETPGTFTYTGDNTFFTDTEQYANYFVSDDPAYGIYKGTKESTEVKNINNPEVRQTIGLHVTYDSNGGEGQVTDPNSPYPEGTEGFTVMGQGDLTRAGYLFCGWGTSPDNGSGVDYQPGEICYFSKADTLYAKWRKALTIEYYLDPADEGVTGDLPPDEIVGEGASHTFADVGNLQRPGYMFDQWVAYNMDGKSAVKVGNSVYSVKAKDSTKPISLSPDWKLIPAAAPVITQQPQNITQGYGTEITLTCEAKPAEDGAEYELSYQWRKYTSTSASTYTEISGATQSTYTLVSPGIGTYYYACAVTATRTDNGAKATVISNKATVTVTKGDAVKTWPTISNLHVNETLASKHLTGGEGAGTFSVPANTSFAAAGDHEVTLTFTPTDTTSYEVVTQTVSVHVSKYPVTSVYVYPRTVTYGTPYADITMPTTVTVYFAKGSRELSVTWDGTQYDPNCNVADGPQYIPGTIAESAEVDVSQTKPECTVTFSPIEIALTIPNNLSATYTGGPIAYPHTPEGVEGLDSLSYEYRKQSTSDTYTSTPPTAAGTYDVKATPSCKPNYGGDPQYLTFTITPFPYGDGTDFTIAEIEPQIHTGSEIKPEPSVKFGETTLTKGTDFDYSYNSNIAPGTQAKVTITFKGNFSGAAEKTFTIENAELPVGTTNDDIFTISGTELMEWHRSDITLTTKDGWTVGLTADSLGSSVTLATESTKDAQGNIVPSSAELFVNDGTNTYQTTVEYRLDKTMPTVTVDGMEGGVNKIWGQEAIVTIHIADALSGVRYVQIMGQVAADTTVEYGDPDYGYKPLPADGTITYTVKANDVYTITLDDNADNRAAWNDELPTFVVEKIDREKPTATFGEITGTQGADGWYTGDITVNVNVDDPETIPDDQNTVAINESNKSGVKNWEYSLDGGTTWKTGSETSFTIDADGDYTDKLKLRATDNAGNVSEIATASAKRDATTPAAPIVTAKAGDADYDGNFTAKPVTLTATANGTMVSGVILQYKTASGDWVNVATVTHSTNTPDAGVVYTFRALSGAGSASSEVTQTVKYRALDESVKDNPANKYGESDFSIDSEGIKDGWYNQDVTVTVTKKENIADGSTRYPAETYYKLDSGEKVKLDGTEIQITGDGEHTLEIWTEDASSNETTHLKLTVKIDKTNPTIENVACNPTDWTKDDANITFTAADETSGVKSVVVTHTDGQSVTYTGSGFTADRNGVYTITVTDKAGNTVTETVTVTKLDKYVPTMPIVTGYTSDAWVKENITFTLSTTDTSATVPSGTRFQVKVGDTDWADVGGSTYTVTSNTNGVTYSFRSISGAGAASETVDFIVKLDKTTPVVSLDVKADGAAYDGQSFTAHDVVITPSNTAENISGTTYFYQKAGDADWTEFTGAALTVDYNCDTTFTFKAVSVAGADSSNQPTAQVKRSAMSDEELVETEYGEGDFTVSPAPNEDGWYNKFPTVTVTPKDTVGTGDGALAATTYYELFKAPAESGNKTKLVSPWQIKPDSDGVWTLKIWTEDAAGNKTKAYTLTLMVDTTVPTIADVAGNPTAWQKTDANITFTAADETSGVKSVVVTHTDGQSVTYTDSGFTADRNGGYVITVTDKAGNSATETVTVTQIDKAAPVVTWDSDTVALSPDKWYGKTALTAEATDDSGNTPTITLTASGKTYANGETIAVTGSYTFTATAKDGAGNVGRSAALSVRIETAIDTFVEMVGKLSENSDYQAILDTVNWYNGQSQTVKDRFSKSDDATEAYEKLMGLLHDKAQEAANGVADKIKDADTIEDIQQAAKDYDALPDSAKDQVPSDVKTELEKKKADADAAQKVIEQLENADRPKTGKDPGGSYEEKGAAQEAYGKLTDNQKALVDKVPAAVEDKNNITIDMGKINDVLDLLKDIKKPYTPATKDQIKDAGDAYNALTDKQKDAFPKSEKERLDKLEIMRQHAQTVEDKIKPLAVTPAQSDLNSAKGAYDALTPDEKAMVDGNVKEALDKKYQDMLDKLGADEKAAAEFAAKVEETKNTPTVEKIEQLIRDHGALSDAAKDKLSEQTKQDYEKLVGDFNAAKEVIKKLDDIDVDNLTPKDMDKVKAALGKDDAQGYDDLTEDQKKLVDEATGGKPGTLQDAVDTVKDATDKIDAIPDHGADSTTTAPDGESVPNLGDCENSQNESTSGNTGGHSYDTHKTAIEEAKIAYEKLTDAGRKLISDEARETLNREYAALMAYLEYINTAKTTTTNVEVAGLAEKVELPTESASAPKTVISVDMADSKPAVMPPVPAGKAEALSVDIKLVASIYDDAAATATPIAQEPVQPKTGETVLVKLKIPTGYQNDTLELWHVKDNGGRSRIENFWLVTETDGVYAVFEVSSFSHFVFFAEKETAPPTPDDGEHGGGYIPPAPKPDITDSDNGSANVTPGQTRPGQTVTIRPEPDEGYVVDEVTVTDQNGKNILVKDNGDGTYSYTQPSGKVTVSVTFKPAETRLPWNPFIDVHEGDWFHDSVKYVYENGLMLGTASDRFSPYLNTSRGMIVTILWRLEGEPASAGAAPFSDVEAGAYYEQAVSWAEAHGIVKGYGNGKFGPNDPITREQLVSILWRYAQCKGMDVSVGENTNILSYKDINEAGEWAIPALQWACGEGLMNGKPGGVLDPRGHATRAEAAAVLMRFHESIAK